MSIMNPPFPTAGSNILLDLFFQNDGGIVFNIWARMVCGVPYSAYFIFSLFVELIFILLLDKIFFIIIFVNHWDIKMNIARLY